MFKSKERKFRRCRWIGIGLLAICVIIWGCFPCFQSLLPADLHTLGTLPIYMTFLMLRYTGGIIVLLLLVSISALNSSTADRKWCADWLVANWIHIVVSGASLIICRLTEHMAFRLGPEYILPTYIYAVALTPVATLLFKYLNRQLPPSLKLGLGGVAKIDVFGAALILSTVPFVIVAIQGNFNLRNFSIISVLLAFGSASSLAVYFIVLSLAFGSNNMEGRENSLRINLLQSSLFQFFVQLLVFVFSSLILNVLSFRGEESLAVIFLKLLQSWWVPVLLFGALGSALAYFIEGIGVSLYSKGLSFADKDLISTEGLLSLFGYCDPIISMLYGCIISLVDIPFLSAHRLGMPFMTLYPMFVLGLIIWVGYKMEIRVKNRFR